jgi:hypothetical protein
MNRASRRPPDVDALAGLALGEIPVVIFLAQVTGRPTLFVRQTRNTSGTCRLVEGRADQMPTHSASQRFPEGAHARPSRVEATSAGYPALPDAHGTPPLRRTLRMSVRGTCPRSRAAKPTS